jgi:hypothetical protein
MADWEYSLPPAWRSTDGLLSGRSPVVTIPRIATGCAVRDSTNRRVPSPSGADRDPAPSGAVAHLARTNSSPGRVGIRRCRLCRPGARRNPFGSPCLRRAIARRPGRSRKKGKKSGIGANEPSRSLVYGARKDPGDEAVVEPRSEIGDLVVEASIRQLGGTLDALMKFADPGWRHIEDADRECRLPITHALTRGKMRPVAGIRSSLVTRYPRSSTGLERSTP